MISMDWLPTLLAAAGTQPDQSYPPDGENLVPVLSGRAAPHARKLFWRFKAGEQRAVRDGDWKYLKIAGNGFLFDVVKDPRERANLKDRNKDVFDRLPLAPARRPAARHHSCASRSAPLVGGQCG